jgi:hypothetical protein
MDSDTIVILELIVAYLRLLDNEDGEKLLKQIEVMLYD